MIEESANIQVAVLLCTKDGERFLAQQLDSIHAQTFSDWKIWCSDDGSRDATLSLLNQYELEWGGKLSVQPGPERGFAANFLSLVYKKEIQADYYAFSDQDDIWEPNKLARALAWLEKVPSSVPALYCSRTKLIDERGHETGFSPLFNRPPSFANALTQCIGGGNTMVFNHAARCLLQHTADINKIVTHDWWVYLLVSGCGGRVYFDPIPSLSYRQHDNNLVGANMGGGARFLRVHRLFLGQFRDWNTINFEALQVVSHLFTAENRQILDQWGKIRTQHLFHRLVGLSRLGLYRQTLAGNIGMLIAALFRRI